MHKISLIFRRTRKLIVKSGPSVGSFIPAIEKVPYIITVVISLSPKFPFKGMTKSIEYMYTSLQQKLQKTTTFLAKYRTKKAVFPL